MSEQPTSPSSASSDSGSSVDRVVIELLAPIIETTGAELVDVEWSGGTLRVVVDETSSESGRITADRLTELNRLISPILDQHDPIPGKYLLEVSSPGVERPLRRAEHFTRAVGEDVIVKLVPGVEPRRMRGLLVAFDDDAMQIDVVEIDGVDLPQVERHEVALGDVSKARTHFAWGPVPKTANQSGKNKKKNKNHQAKKPTGSGKKKQAGKNKHAGKKPSGKAGAKPSGRPPTSGDRGKQ